MVLRLVEGRVVSAKMLDVDDWLHEDNDMDEEGNKWQWNNDLEDVDVEPLTDDDGVRSQAASMTYR